MSPDEFDRALARLAAQARASGQRLDELSRRLQEVGAVMDEVASSYVPAVPQSRSESAKNPRANDMAGNGTSDADAAQVEVVSK